MSWKYLTRMLVLLILSQVGSLIVVLTSANGVLNAIVGIAVGVLWSELYMRWNPYSTEPEHFREAWTRSNAEIEQVLGKALGYPWFKDDQKNFPGATEANGVCVGEHTAETLAEEAARAIIALRQRVEGK